MRTIETPEPHVLVIFGAPRWSRATNSAPLSVELVMSTLREGSRYPLDMFWHIARVTGVAITTLVVRAFGAGGEWRPVDRAAHRWRGAIASFGAKA